MEQRRSTTLRLPLPPLPPKPLHLTVRSSSSSSISVGPPRTSPLILAKRNALPAWTTARAFVDETPRDSHTIPVQPQDVTATEKADDCEVGEKNGDERWSTVKSDLEVGGAVVRERRDELGVDAVDRLMSRRIGSGGSSQGNRSLHRRRRRSATRLYIFFDDTLPNPLIDPASSPSPSPPSLIDHSLYASAESTSCTQQQQEETIDHHLEMSSQLSPSFSDRLLDLPLQPTPAISLHSFYGEAEFGELSFEGSVALLIEVEDVGGGWSVGYEREKGEDGRGLIPRGWYAYIEESESGDEEQDDVLSDVGVAPVNKSSGEADDRSAVSSSHSSPSSQLRSSFLAPLDGHTSSEAALALPDSLPSSSERYTEGRSIGRNVVISGIMFEPTDRIYLDNTFFPTPAPSSPTTDSDISSTYDELLARLSPSKRIETINTTDADDLSNISIAASTFSTSPIHSIVLADIARVEQHVPRERLLSDGGVVTNEDDKATILSDEAMDDDLPTSSTLPALSQQPPIPTDITPEDDNITAVSDKAAVDSHEIHSIVSNFHPELPPSSPSAFPYSRITDSSRSKRSDHDHRTTVLASLPPPSNSAINTLSKSLSSTLPAIYSLGLGTLGRSYALTGLGGLSGIDATKQRKRVRLGATSKANDVIQDWILRGDDKSPMVEGQKDLDGSLAKYHIDSGPEWRSEGPKYTVRVHSPELTPSLDNVPEHITYQLTTTFQQSHHVIPTSSPSFVNVDRRYSHFALLYSLLTTRYPILVVPALPPKSYMKLSDATIEMRRRDLERWVGRIALHNVLRSSEEMRGFLGIEQDEELRDLLQVPTSSTPSAAFFSKVFHGEFNVDYHDSAEMIGTFERHVSALETGGGIREIEVSFGKLRESARDLSHNSSLFAHALVRLVSDRSTEEDNSRSDSILTGSTSFAWKEHCDDSLALSKAIQATAEAIDDVARSFNDKAHHDMLSIQELLREHSDPFSKHSNLIDHHRLVLRMHEELSNPDDQDINDAALSRCDTILNITSAEIERVDKERLADLRAISEKYLDGQIACHEQALSQLRFARSHFDSLDSLAQTGPRLPSRLEHPFTPSPPLIFPSTYTASSVSKLPPLPAVDDVKGMIGSVLGMNRSSRIKIHEMSMAAQGTARHDTGDTLKGLGTRRAW